MRTEQFRLSDGRNLDLLISSHISNKAILFHHGTPSDSTLWTDWIAEFEFSGITCIAYSRPGYATSDRQQGRRVVDILKDLVEVTNNFGIEHFVSVGWSGGGPHALATTLDPRCRGVISIAGVGAYGVPDLDFMAGMGPENIEEFGCAVAGQEALTEWMEKNSGAMAGVTADELREALGGLISDADKAVLASKYAEGLASNFRRSLSLGYFGWFDDDLAFVRDWGFPLTDIAVPVFLWQGDEDLMVPHAHGEWLLQKIPTAQIVRKPGEGHLSVGENCRSEIFANINQVLG